MRARSRTLLASAAVALLALVGASVALACGTGGYSYAGIASSSHAFGIGATVTPLAGFNVLSGRVPAYLPPRQPGPLVDYRDRRELGRRHGRFVQRLPLSVPPRLDRPRPGRRLAAARRRLPDQQLDNPSRAEQPDGWLVPRGAG